MGLMNGLSEEEARELAEVGCDLGFPAAIFLGAAEGVIVHRGHAIRCYFNMLWIYARQGADTVVYNYRLHQFLGIPSEGISPDSLRGLIAATIKDGKPKAGPSALDPGVLLDHFENQRLTDCAIRVRLNQPSMDPQRIKAGVPPPPARKRTMSIGGMSKQAQAVPVPEYEGDVRIIKAHNIILSSRSRYFEKALQKAGPEKVVDVTLADEEGELATQIWDNDPLAIIICSIPFMYIVATCRWIVAVLLCSC